MALSAAEKEELAQLSSEAPGDVPVQSSSRLSASEAQELAQLQREVAPQESTRTSMKNMGLKTLAGLGKASSVLYGTTTGPALGAIMEALTGKKMYDASDVGNAINPTNFKGFPSVDQMMEKAGVAQGSRLSDVLPGFSDPGKGQHWYSPEKGGALDLTARGTGAGVLQAAIDPGTWLTLGESAAAKGAANTASKQVLQNAVRAAESLPTKILKSPYRAAQAATDVISAPAKGVAELVNATPGVGKAAPWVLNPVGQGLSKVGKTLYGSPLLPVEQLGEKFRKSDVANDLYNAGITNPLALNQKARGALDTLGSAQSDLLHQADQAGGVLSMDRATEPAMEKLNALRRLKDPDAAAVADAMQERLDAWKATERGSPGTSGTPARTISEPSALLDESGRPFLHERTIPGTPGTPAQPPSPYSPSQGSQLKTYLYNGVPDSKWALASQSSPGQGVTKAMASGLKSETENAVERALGGGAGADLADINRAYGGLAATQPAQRTVSNRAGRQMGQMTELSPADTIMGAIGTDVGGARGGAMAIAAKKLGTLAQVGKMPTGYALRQLAEDPLMATLLTNASKNKLNKVRRDSPWLKEENDQ